MTTTQLEKRREDNKRICAQFCKVSEDQYCEHHHDMDCMLARLIDENKLRTRTMTVEGTSAVQQLTLALVSRSFYFQVEPIPDDQYNITVKAEDFSTVLSMAELCKYLVSFQ